MVAPLLILVGNFCSVLVKNVPEMAEIALIWEQIWLETCCLGQLELVFISTTVWCGATLIIDESPYYGKR